MIALLITHTYFVLMPDKWSAGILEIYPLPVSFRFALLGIALLNLLACISFEKLVIDYCLGKCGWGLWLASFSWYRRLLGERDFHELQYTL